MPFELIIVAVSCGEGNVVKQLIWLRITVQGGKYFEYLVSHQCVDLPICCAAYHSVSLPYSHLYTH